MPRLRVSGQDRHAMLAHEVEGSVASLRAIARVLADAGPDMWPNLAGVLLDEADRLAMLIDDSRDERSVTGWVASPRSTCHMPVLLAAAQGYASRLQPDREIELELDIVPEPVVGQPHRVGQVLRNLLDNALKYTPPGTPIRLCLRTMPAYLEVSIIDHGPGLSPQDGARVFLPGVRSTSPADMDGSGQGLGLALCRSIVEGWGGHIWCVATPGGGATFSFTMPRVPRPAVETLSPSSWATPAPGTGADMRIDENRRGDV